MRHFTAIVFCALFLIACCEPNPAFFAEENSGLHTTILSDSTGRIISTDLYLDYPADSFLTEFEIGDIVTVAIIGYDTLEMPVVESTNDVPIAGFSLSAVSGSQYLVLAIHYGEPADVLKITDAKTPIEVIVTLKDKGGYLFGLDIMRHAQYMSAYVESYPDLSIEEFANFREVRTTGMGTNKLYRSSSPINLSLGRYLYVDSLAKEAGIATFINLTDTENGAKSYKGFESTYYSTQDAVFLSMPVRFFSTPFKEGLATGFRYMIEHEAPYLVHCTYGMDRTGFTIAVLEALMGATAEEIQADYAKTFTNYFSVFDSKQVALNEDQVNFFKDVVLRNLRAVYHAEGIDVPDTGNADWAFATEKYLQRLGMTAEEISALKEKLK
ncbi:tyrosine-protein phosphatase [Fibrobacter sp. UWB11]|uniref:tyrosine-protein phosphatase n=1 Tax=Fibrobacter sp. UWB11 TaxID=1896202 RepID=UPI0009295613|nr:tyrosine-protein phosphatase [Fibrobacter sp. UWB11]SIO06583.1 Tyrosine phosphatase family protein [Fibrobacter sp. UWB11]